jgi:hypothetical protein
LFPTSQNGPSTFATSWERVTMLKLLLAGTMLWAATFMTTVASAEDLTIPGEIDPAAIASQATANALVPPVPAPHEPTVPSEPGAKTRPSKSFNLDLKVDGDGFRLGGYVSGDKGVSGAWLGARTRGNGAMVEAGVQGNEGPSRDVRLNVDLLPGWAATAARLWLLFH